MLILKNITFVKISPGKERERERKERKQKVRYVKVCFRCVSHSHSCAVNWVVLFVHPSRLQLVLHQVEQRVTDLLLINADNSVRHGKHFHHICCDPAT